MVEIPGRLRKSIPTIPGFKRTEVNVEVDGVNEATGKLSFRLELTGSLEATSHIGPAGATQVVVYQHRSRTQDGKQRRYHHADQPWIGDDTEDALRNLATWVDQIEVRLASVEITLAVAHIIIRGIKSDWRVSDIWRDVSTKELSPDGEYSALCASTAY